MEVLPTPRSREQVGVRHPVAFDIRMTRNRPWPTTVLNCCADTAELIP